MGNTLGSEAFDPQRIPYEQRREVVNMDLSLRGIANVIKQGKANNIVVLAGAGMSVAAGVPDFRSPRTGLYSRLERYNIPQPEAVFDIDYFRRNPATFYQENLLLRVYTQNVDTLERDAGVPDDRIVEAHGSFATASCLKCHAKYSKTYLKEQIFSTDKEDFVPRCTVPTCDGVIKPDITFFGEMLPQRFGMLHEQDMSQCDLLIVIGSSLLVQPVAQLPSMVSNLTPRLLINKEKTYLAADPPQLDNLESVDDADLGMIGGNPGGFRFDEEDNYRDVLYEGEAEKGVKELCKELDWQTKLDEWKSEVEKTEMVEQTEEEQTDNFGAAAVAATDKNEENGTVSKTEQTESNSTKKEDPNEETRQQSIAAAREAGKNATDEQLDEVTKMMRKSGLNVLEQAEDDVKYDDKR